MTKSTAMAILLGATLSACQSDPAMGPADNAPESQRSIGILIDTNNGDKVTTGGITIADVDNFDVESCEPGGCISSLLGALFAQPAAAGQSEKLSFVAHGVGTTTTPAAASGRFSAKVFTGANISGDITCMKVVANEARAGGIVTKSNDPDLPPGTEVFWVVEDNGEGQPKTDGYSGLFFGFAGSAEAHCAGAIFETGLSQIGTGNVQIHKATV